MTNNDLKEASKAFLIHLTVIALVVFTALCALTFGVYLILWELPPLTFIGLFFRISAVVSLFYSLLCLGEMLVEVYNDK